MGRGGFVDRTHGTRGARDQMCARELVAQSEAPRERFWPHFRQHFEAHRLSLAVDTPPASGALRLLEEKPWSSR